jgi:hypothetical protein
MAAHELRENSIMKLKIIVAGIGVAAGISLPGVVPALAADLDNGASQTCSGIAAWHFVNNQTGGAAPGTLTAEFSDGAGNSFFYTVGASAVNRSTQHFYVFTEGDATLVTASTGELPGRLVLSDLDCDTGKKEKK